MRNNKSKLKIFAALPALALLLWAGDKPFDARDMFYSASEMMPGKKPAEGSKRPPQNTRPQVKDPVSRPQPELAMAVKEPEIHFASLKGTLMLGLRYSILQKTPQGLQEVRPDRAFHAGDSIRVSVMGNQKGYLYIIARGTSGLWTPLFPHPESAQRSNEIVPGRKYQVPDGPGEFYTFDERGGEEHLFLLLSKVPVRDLDEVIRSLTEHAEPKRNAEPAARPVQPPLRVMEAQNRLDDKFVDQLRADVQSRDLMFTKTDDAPASSTSAVQEDAVYVINAGSANVTDARVMVDVKLIHR